MLENYDLLYGVTCYENLMKLQSMLVWKDWALPNGHAYVRTSDNGTNLCGDINC